MRAFLLVGCSLLGQMLPAFGQTTEASLRALYGEPVNSTFIVKPNVKLHAVYGSGHQACVLTISGPLSQEELMKTFDAVVPAKTRGVKGWDLEECAGGCLQYTKFPTVDLTLGVIGATQVSEPDALVVFKRKDCERAAEDAKKIVFHTKSTRR